MSRILYFDCFSGISGDMVLGAFLDAGLPLEDLKRALGSLALSDVEVGATRVLRAGVSATKFTVKEASSRQPSAVSSDRHAGQKTSATPDHQHTQPHAHEHGHEHALEHHGHDHHEHGHSHEHGHEPHAHEHHHRSLPEIYALIDASALSATARDRAKALFHRLAEAEAAIHQMPIDKVHLHEVGAIDSIVDIVGAAYALEWAGADRVVCSPLNVGGGMVDSAHGRFPVPAPATLRLLTESGAPLYSGAVQQELVTPTGALIATGYASSYGPVPAMTVERVGYGAGDRDPRETPNVLRLLIGQVAEQPHGDRVLVVECEIDDMNPQIFGVAMDRLYAAGALEVFYVPVQMKKNRPGTLLTVIARPEQRAAIADILFRETTTIGIRHSDVQRECLRRDIIDVETPVGLVRFKRAWRDGRIVNSAPEFDDCARIAAARRLSVKDVQAIAVQAYGERAARGIDPHVSPSNPEAES